MTLAQKNFADLITFSRSSVAWRFNALGLLESVPANEPRFDYDPLTHQLRGLLIEEQRTNTFLNSGNLSLISMNAGATADETPVMAPDGQLAARVIHMTGSAASGVYRTNAANSTSQQCWSVFIRSVTGNGLVRLQLGGTAYATTRSVDFDLINGRIVTSAGATGFIAKLTAEGWYRVAITAPVDNIDTPVHNATVYAGDTTAKSVALWGGQVETGAFPTSYIPTTTAQVTRAADIAYIGNTAPWFNPLEGTLFVEASASVIPVGNAGAATAGITGPTGLAERILGMQFTATLVRAGGLGTGGADTALFNVAGAPVAGKVYKGAAAWAPGNARGALNGTLSPQVTTSPIPGPLTRMAIGAITGASQLLNGHIRNIRYYPRRLTDAELQALTA